jgi:predicted thioredoxin/glutaredoxin
MKKMILFLTVLWLGLNAFAKSVKADDYNKAVVGHVIQSTIHGDNVDVSKLMEQELEKLAHQFAFESITIIQQYLPVVLDGVFAELRMKADKEYKCALLEGSKIEDKECQ